MESPSLEVCQRGLRVSQRGEGLPEGSEVLLKGREGLQREDRCLNIPTYGIPPHSTGLPPIGPLPKKALAIQSISR